MQPVLLCGCFIIIIIIVFSVPEAEQAWQLLSGFFLAGKEKRDVGKNFRKVGQEKFAAGELGSDLKKQPKPKRDSTQNE